MRLQLPAKLLKNKTTHIVIVTIFFVMLFLVYFNSILFSDHLIVSDGLIPAYFKIHNWSRFVFSGFPLITDPIWNVFDPLRIIIYAVLHLDFNFFIISGYFLMACFTYAYVYFLTRVPIAAGVSAILYSFSGYAIFEIGHAANFVHTICWLPLILLALEKLKTTFSTAWFLTGTAAVAMTIFGGFPQLSFAICFVVLTYALMLSVQTEKKLKKIGFYFGMVIAGYLLATPLIIPTLILSLHSTREHLTWEMFSTYPVDVKQLLLFNFPYLMGGYYGVFAKIPPFEEWEIVGNHGYLGFLSLILAGIGTIKRPLNLKPTSYYWLGLSILSILVALGPQIHLLYRILFHIPIVNNFRAPERYLFIFSFGVSVLAGFGIQAMTLGNINSRREKHVIYISSLLFAGLLLGSVAWLYPQLRLDALHFSNFQLPPFWQNSAVTIPLAWIVFSLIVLFYWLKQPRSQLRGFITCIVLISEVLYSAYFSYWHPGYSLWTQQSLSSPPAYLIQIKNNLNTSNQRYLTMLNAQTAADPIGRYFSLNFPIYYQLPSAGGDTPLSMLRYQLFLQIDGGASYAGPPQQFQDNQAINIAGIKYLITAPTPLNAVWFKDKNHFVLRSKINDMLIYENLKALPRVWFTAKVSTLPADTLLQAIHTGKFSDGTIFDPAKVALVEQAQNFQLAADNTAHANIKTLTDNEVVITTQSKTKQFLVLSDAYYPGWKAYIDGQKTTFYLTDYVYRGLIVPAGKHVITYKFIPRYLYASYAIAFLTLCGLLIYCVRRSMLKST